MFRNLPRSLLGKEGSRFFPSRVFFPVHGFSFVLMGFLPTHSSSKKRGMRKQGMKTEGGSRFCAEGGPGGYVFSCEYA